MVVVVAVVVDFDLGVSELHVDFGVAAYAGNILSKTRLPVVHKVP